VTLVAFIIDQAFFAGEDLESAILTVFIALGLGDIQSDGIGPDASSFESVVLLLESFFLAFVIN
jgi:hypothetical protein